MYLEENQEFIAPVMCAGSIDARGIKGEDCIEAVYHAASHVHDTEQVAFVWNNDGQKVHYISAPATAFASARQWKTRLSQALPGSKNYRGPGAYWVTNGQKTAVIISDANGHHKCEVKAHQQAIDYASAHYGSSQIFEIDTQIDPEPWIFFNLRKTKASVTEAQKFHKIAGSGFKAALILCVIVALIKGYLSSKSVDYRADTIKNAQAVFAQVNDVQPLQRQMNELQRIKILLAKAGGTLNFYRFNGTDTTWEMEIPNWFPADKVSQAFGPIQVPIPNASAQTLIIRNQHAGGVIK